MIQEAVYEEEQMKCTTKWEAFYEGFTHPIMWGEYVNDNEFIAKFGSAVRMTLMLVAGFSILFIAFFNRKADEHKIKIFNDKTGKWQIWSKIAKNWIDE